MTIPTAKACPSGGRVVQPAGSGGWPGRILRAVSGAAAGLALLLPAAVAQEDESLGRFRDWYAATFVEDGARVCYMVSKPTKSEGNYTRRGPVYVQVTRRAGGGSGDVVSIEAGYPYGAGGEVNVSIDDEGYTLFTDGETAWAYSADDDRALVAAMAGGAEMIVKGPSARGTPTTDTYSLLGFTAARRAMAEKCAG